MNSRERVRCAIEHKQPDKLPVDFGSTMATGINISTVYKLRQKLGLDKPGTPVKVIEPFQMLGEISYDLKMEIGIDCIPILGKYNFFGFENKDWKEWKLWDGTPVLVPGLFNTVEEEDGSLLMYPQGDTSATPCARMPRRGYYFDLIVRQPNIDDNNLEVEDNTMEFKIITDGEIKYLKKEIKKKCYEKNYSIVSSLVNTGFGDIGVVPGPALKYPMGIRDPEEWYVSIHTRKNFIKKVFNYQCEIAIENYKKINDAIGDKIDIVCTSYTDFGMQNGLLISGDAYRDLFKPFNRKINKWVHNNTDWKCFMHNDGSIYDLIPDFIDAEFDILNPVQISAAKMDPKKLKQEFGKYIAFWGGGVDTQKTLPFLKPKDVKDEVRRNIELLNRNGGYVFSSIHNIQANIPLENIIAMIEAIKEYR